MNWRNLLGLATLFLLLLALSLVAAASLAPPAAQGSASASRPTQRQDRALASSGLTDDPNPFGYTCTDSNEPGGAIFAWLDITDGTQLAPPDDGATDVTVPFTFTLFALSTRNASVYNDGLLLFDAIAVILPQLNEPLATVSLTNLIAPFWHDFDDTQGGVYSKTLGTAPHRRFVVEWHDRLHWTLEQDLSSVTFEMILYEGTNNIKFQYLDTSFESDELDYGRLATVGIRQDDNNYLQYSYNEPVLLPEMAICFQYPGSPPCDVPRIDVSPAAISATQLAGEVTTHTLTISNTGDADLSFELEEISPAIVSDWFLDSPQIDAVNDGPEAIVQADVPWVAVDPITGTVASGDSLQVNVVFTAPQGVYGTYTATLRITSNDPSTQPADLPLTMAVLLPPELSVTKHASADRLEIGSLLTYTLSISNSGGPVSNVSVSDTLPHGTRLAWIADGGAQVGDDDIIVWSGLDLPEGASQALSCAVTVTCVPTGTQIVNSDYQVAAPGWPPPVQGQPVTVTAVAEGAAADFDTPDPIVCREPVSFTNLSQRATAFLWDFGDGFTSTLPGPVHTYTERGIYPAILTASNLCSTDIYSQALSVQDFALSMAPGLGAGQSTPGQTVVYTLSLANSGTLSDTFTLGLAGHLWGAALSTEAIGPLAAGSSASFQVVVSVPPDARVDDCDTVVVQAVSDGDPRQPPAQATSTLTTTVLPYALYLPLIWR
jgi:uncharacterized repeat protein (TIGR01451 family)